MMTFFLLMTLLLIAAMAVATELGRSLRSDKLDEEAPATPNDFSAVPWCALRGKATANNCGDQCPDANCCNNGDCCTFGTCCGDACCPNPSTCCGTECCSSISQVCCYGSCFTGLPGFICCGTRACPGDASCCGDLCCPSPLLCCGSYCCIPPADAV